MLLATTATLLPSDTSYLGMGTSSLCAIDDCRLLDFLAHGRMSYGGALVGVGVMTGWLTAGPLRRDEPWAWWTLLFAAAATFGSFLTFLVSHGYFDWTLALFLLTCAPLCALGLWLTHRRAKHGVGLVDAFREPDVKGWVHSREGRPRLLIAALGAGVGLAGIGILMIASSVVFVPQDTTFLNMDLEEVSDVAQRLGPLMAHDRAAYGGSMIAIGGLFAATALKGLRPGKRGGKLALLISGVFFYLSTVAIHIAIGYTDLIHLLPVYAGLACLLVSLRLLAGAED